ncbi:MAG: methyltransferase domain-containing protein [Planctomycetota bacterium]
MLRNRAALRRVANEAPGVKLHLGCGEDYKRGYINVDVLPSAKCDLISRVEDLRGIPNASVACIESYHLVEHLRHSQLKASLSEWSRVLRPGGELHVELPNFQQCIENLGAHFHNGHDLAMVGIYGFPPDIEAEPFWQQHKWGWTPATLGGLIGEFGFRDVAEATVRQDWREAAKFGRDMHLVAIRDESEWCPPSEGAS